MRVALVNVDSKIPNLALMKLSTYHKECGDEGKLYEPLFDNPQLCYVSKIFTFTPEPQFLPDCVYSFRMGQPGTGKGSARRRALSKRSWN